MTRVAGKTVLVTGAGMGMGRRHAERAVERGAARLVLWDINEQALAETKSALSGGKTTVDTYVVNVAHPDEIEAGAERTLREVGSVQVLFNNAGVVVPGDFLSHRSEDIEKTIRVNTLGIMHVARAFLPGMIASKEAHLVNIASASSLMPLPYGSVYAASKWAAYCWSESVRLELKDQGHSHVRVTTVCPSFVATGMFEGANAPRLTRFLTTDEIVDHVWRALEGNKLLVIAPSAARMVMPLRGLLPTTWFDFLADKIFGSYGAMKQLRGRRAMGKPAAERERVGSAH